MTAEQAKIATVRRPPIFKGGACVITGPSGVGKSTLIKKLMAEFPDHFGFSVSHTTRDPRPGEQDGVDYHFVTREQMQGDIDAGLFVEHAEVHGNLYGTSISAVQEVTKKGRVCLLDIDVQGAESVRRSALSKTCSFVFFAPPTAAVLEQRLRGRGTETEERIQKRLAGSLRELSIYEGNPDAWDLTLKWYNEQVEDAYQEFRSFLYDQIPKQAPAEIATVRRPPIFKGGACVITGPSGVGKSTLIKKLMAEFPDHFGFSVSHTTRDPRPGEQDGVDYHFVTREQMQGDIDAGLFVEHAEVHGNLYGTSISAVQEVTKKGRVCLLDIDVQGAESVRRSALSKTCSFVFFAPPTAAVLEQRLRGRGTETEERIQKRLAGSLRELSIYEGNPDAWDLTLKWYNEQVEDAYQEFRSFLYDQIPKQAPAEIATVRRPPIFKGGACVITGPSGVGKSTLIKKLMAEFPDHFGFSVSHTTRDPRPGEQDGVDYHFVTREQMQGDIDAGLFVEHAEVHGNLYGTSISAVQEVTKKCRVCLLDIDVQGAESVRRSALSKTCSFVFFAPPTAAVLEQRLRGRGTETEERIQKRLAGSLRELSIYEGNPDAWDLTLKWYNEQVEDAYQEFRSFLYDQIPKQAPAEIATVRRPPIFKGGACVITGPSGVGKSTLIKKLMAEFPDHFGFSVSHTTRDPRPGEQDGVDYHFVSREQMQGDIDAGLFVEHAEVHGNLYGTSISAVQEVTKKGRVCLLDIDVQGAESVRRSALSKTCSFVFFAPPTAAVLEQRLRGRGTETEERIQKRLAGSLRELSIYEGNPDAWDLTLKWYNEQVEDAYQEFRSFLYDQIPKQAPAEIATVRRPPIFKGGACVITGPSGVGKSTLIKKLMAEFPDHFGFSVSHTTRDPRPGEQDGVDYHFVTREQMQGDIDAGLFVEHAEVHGNLYGTSISAVQEVTKKGRVCLLDIDVQGAESVRRSALSKTCSFVFFAPPTAAVLEQRLRGRGTETEERIQKRLAGSLRELSIYEGNPDAWDLTLKWYNEQVEDAYQEFRSFLYDQIPKQAPAEIATVRRPPIFKGGACVITGPSGVGKSTLIKKLMAEFPDHFGFSVSHTTRDPRPGEQDGVDYHFVTREQMQGDIDAGLFVEHAEVHGNLYGTSISAVQEVTKKGRVCLLDIDVQGAESVRRSALSKTCSFVFFAPPTAAVLEQRLRGRGTETEERIQKRLAGSLRELSIYEGNPDAWDLTLKWYNEQVEDAYQEFRSFLKNQMK